ncbi:MAG: outer membrane protein assembly factor BamE [Alphaproteobacteria bacterium]|nr:outer membrane protein assembly factor BamE [Alphaproteobacteria bacterium]
MQRALLMMSSFIALTACTPIIDNRGYDFEIVDVNKIHTGQTKEEVIQVMGSPSTLSTFKDNAWYYVSKKTATKSFFTPEILDQKVIIVHFVGDTVSRIETINKDQAAKIELSKNETQTSGYESGIMREVFGNFGNFGKSKAPTKS